MPDVVNPTDSLYSKLQAYNRRRSSDWERLGASVIPTVAAAQRGADPSAVARSFYPTYPAAPDALTVAAWKKSLIDSAVKANKDREDRRASFAKQLQSNTDKLIDLMKSAGAVTGQLSGDWAQVANNVRDNMRQFSTRYMDALEANAKGPDVKDPAGVERKFNELVPLLTPGGTADPSFARNLASFLQSADTADQQALYMRLEAAAAAKGESIDNILAGMPKDQDAQAALAVFDGLRPAIDQIRSETLALEDKTVQDGLRTMPTGGGAGVDTVIKMFNLMKDATGIAGANPDDMKKQLDALTQGIEGGAPGQAGSPDDVKKYADLMDDLDSDAPAANLAEARQRLFADPEFKAWMQQNGYSDPRMALKELRRMLHLRVHANQQKDLAVTRERRLAEVGPNSGATAPSQSANVAAVGQPRPANDGDNAVRYVMGPDGFYVWNGKAMSKASEEDLSFLDPDSPDFQEAAAGAILGPEEFDRLKKLSDDNAAKAKAEAPVTVGGEQQGPTVGMLANDARFGATHPAMMVGNAATLVRNKIADALQKRREKKAIKNADEALDMDPSLSP